MLGRSTIKESDAFSKRYVTLNTACHQLGEEIKQPLYLIDSMFSLMVHGVESLCLATIQNAPGAVHTQGFADIRT